MKNKRTAKRLVQKLNAVLTIFMILFAVLAPLQNVKAEAPLVYAVENEEDFLRLVTFLSNSGNHNPVILSQTGQLDDRISTFTKYYQRTVSFLSPNQVNELIRTGTDQSQVVVLAENTPEATLVASAIAARLKTPLFIGNLLQTKNEEKQTAKIISIGNNHVSCKCEVIALTAIDLAVDYYNQLVNDSDTVVFVDDTGVSAIAAEEIIFHRAKLAFDLSKAKAANASNLIWVTSPGHITKENIKDLYQEPGQRVVYSENIGVITGFDLEDMSLLVARTTAYPSLVGEWKSRVLNANIFDPDMDTQSADDSGTLIKLGGKRLTADTFDRAVRTVGYIFVSAHGSGSGFLFNNSRWPVTNATLSLPPVIFVAEACKTADVTEDGLDNSVALKVLSSGAVAYIGSIDVGGVALVSDQPFLNSTKQTPLGELVRLENSARMDVDEDYPRAVLFGDPTFYQLERDDFSVTQLAGSKETGTAVFQIYRQERGNVAIGLTQNQGVIRVNAALKNGKIINYYLGASHFGSPLSVIQTHTGQKLFFEWPGGEGQIKIYSSWSVSTWIQKVFSDAITGLQAILLDLTTINGNPWYLPVIIFVLVILNVKKYKKNRLFLALPMSLILSAAIALLFWGVNIEILLPVSLSIALWCFFSIAITSAKKGGLKFAVLPLFLFITPFLIGLLLVLGVNGSAHVVCMIVEGITLLSLTYLLAFFALSKLMKFNLSSFTSRISN
jgi:hypothetical protein